MGGRPAGRPGQLGAGATCRAGSSSLGAAGRWHHRKHDRGWYAATPADIPARMLASSRLRSRARSTSSLADENAYHGTVEDRGILGTGRPVAVADIDRANRLAAAVSMSALVVAVLIRGWRP